ncbi:MAG: 4Fe-4S dicluster domain-containing protein [Gammaproteobacteria bacterium]|jgi:formate dehydrogenase (NADP+) beta subunit|nr:4Fe-4S dicluster domain-containing protein [Gammaproteobacteria bacterium]NBP06860.1 4Fe-4S dicluster domain-containing protein [Gammaproteobacteria bacterium]NBR16632.1 4Fe-4S dicluster domain-containing protein [Gammaproteobacteria bacterium]NDF85066.1 4Fe-4S dicluster domain-containing protein [Gammaproteobacteria bacterium]
MAATDSSHPDYFHKVVDCQWACPAHTDVPEYIRLIAQGRFTDAYMVNRRSNVFPGVLGRVCDRPCEPACRRGRVEQKPVAICRLKRVAADHKDEFRDLLPPIPTQKNGKRIACIGAGCASLTVANDLMPLGYEVTIFEQFATAGGLMRTNIPSFRLPADVLDEEIGAIVDMGVDLRLGHRIESMRKLLDEGGFDAIFVGSGAPKGKELSLPGRQEGAANIHIGISWLESIAFDHVKSVGQNVLIIGVGNTAMDCCRSSLRLGAKSVKVMARKPRQFFKASEWELEDAEAESVEIIINRSPKSFVIEGGRLKGMIFEVMEYDIDARGRITAERIAGEEFHAADDVILAIGQENAFPWIERDLGIEFDKWDVPKVDATTFESTRAGVFFGGDAAFGPKNIIWSVEHGHQAAISIHRHCQGKSVADRMAPGVNLQSRKMGMHEWSYANDYSAAERRLVPHVSLKERFKKINIEVELGFTAEQAAEEVQRCLNCDVQTIFEAKLCIECDACIDICPVDCLTMTPDGSEDDLRTRLKAPAKNVTQALYVSTPLKFTGRVMVKDEDVCVHCGLCAERCPTAAWDMQKSWVKWPHAVDQPATATP